MSNPAIVPPKAGTVITKQDTGMQYILGNEIGSGGYGVTYECEDLFNQPMVAKVLRPRGEPKSTIRQEWEKEFSLLSMLRHPNVIHVYDAFEAGNLFYLILERAHGNLRQLIESNGPFDERGVVETGRQLLSAVHYIHSVDVIHRDLHIDNILYIQDSPRYFAKISDFGISKLLGQPSEGPAFTRVGREYEVAPELFSHGYTTKQSDIYQVGLILYFLYTGYAAVGAYDGPQEHVVLSGLSRQRAEALGTPLGHCIAMMLRRLEEGRFQTAVDAWMELRSTITWVG